MSQIDLKWLIKSIWQIISTVMTSIDHIDLNLLRVFHAIVEEQSLTRAGVRLGLSQPAISYSLGRLRTLFDDPLFIRTRSCMQPTPTALELATIVGRALDTVRDALRYAERFDASTSSRTFRISLSDAGELAYLPLICEALHRHAPTVKLQVLSVPLNAIEELLRSSRLDFAIGHLPGLTAQTEHAVLFEEDYVCMTRARVDLPQGGGGHGRASGLGLGSGIGLSREAFTSATHVRVSSVEQSHLGIDAALRNERLTRNIALDLSHFASVPSVLAVTDHFATLPRRLAHIFNGDGAFAIYELPVRLPLAAITMHWHAHFTHDEGNQWLRTLMAEAIQAL
jgi:DNA-binding transcriptional LysR family regulator